MLRKYFLTSFTKLFSHDCTLYVMVDSVYFVKSTLLAFIESFQHFADMLQIVHSLNLFWTNLQVLFNLAIFPTTAPSK